MSATGIEAGLARLRRNRFAVMGRVGMDLMADPPGTAIEQAQGFTAALGGSAGNIAAALACQGATVEMISALSDDAVGRFVRADLARRGIGATHVAQVGNGTRTSLALTETRLSPCQTVIYRNDAADLELTADHIKSVDFGALGALVITGTALAREPSRGAVFAALAAARDAGALCILDVDYRAYTWASAEEARQVCLTAAQRCDIVVGNDEEWGLMAGGVAAGPALARTMAQAGATFVVLKLGAAGSTTFVGDRAFDSPAFSVAARKPTGAGDGFMGGLLAALARGVPLADAVICGAATAAIVVAGIGCAPASPDLVDLQAFLVRNGQGKAKS